MGSNSYAWSVNWCLVWANECLVTTETPEWHGPWRPSLSASVRTTLAGTIKRKAQQLILQDNLRQQNKLLFLLPLLYPLRPNDYRDIPSGTRKRKDSFPGCPWAVRSSPPTSPSSCVSAWRVTNSYSSLLFGKDPLPHSGFIHPCKSAVSLFKSSLIFREKIV